jgi:DNA-binding response OmpR family regulator
MKLDYNILWFEDNTTWYNSITPFLKEILEENGFQLKVKRRVNQNELELLIEDDKWDLILVDYNLSDGETGDDIIQMIRDTLFTDIIFYSQRGGDEVRKEVMSKGIDGIFCAGRSRPEFLRKVERVINTTIKKATDINPLRGLVMAETSEIDDLMREILITFMGNTKYHKRTELLNYICKTITNSLKSSQKQLEKLCKAGNTEQLISLPFFDSSKKIRAIEKMIKFINEEKLNEFQGIATNYYDDIGLKRNLLAHVSEDIIDGNRVLVSHVPNTEPIAFDAESCKKMRTDIRSYKESFENIKGIISES